MTDQQFKQWIELTDIAVQDNTAYLEFMKVYLSIRIGLKEKHDTRATNQINR